MMQMEQKQKRLSDPIYDLKWLVSMILLWRQQIVDSIRTVAYRCLVR